MGVNFFVFNAAAFALMDPFADPHLTLALHSVAIALAVTVLVLAGVIADHCTSANATLAHGRNGGTSERA